MIKKTKSTLLDAELVIEIKNNMLFIIGLIVVFSSVITGYMMHHGKLEILWQPNEIVIIGGAAIGAFIISNTGIIIKRVLKSFKFFFKGKPYKKSHYIELLCFIYDLFKMMKAKGMLAIESHIENPHDSDLFKKYPTILNDHHVVDLFC
ncbi:MAG: hypothetical protein EOO93_26265, partial [Pedobacter sp.]